MRKRGCADGLPECRPQAALINLSEHSRSLAAETKKPGNAGLFAGRRMPQRGAPRGDEDCGQRIDATAVRNGSALRCVERSASAWRLHGWLPGGTSLCRRLPGRASAAANRTSSFPWRIPAYRAAIVSCRRLADCDGSAGRSGENPLFCWCFVYFRDRRMIRFRDLTDCDCVSPAGPR